MAHEHASGYVSCPTDHRLVGDENGYSSVTVPEVGERKNGNQKVPTFRLVVESLAKDKLSLTLPFPTSPLPCEIRDS